METPRFPVSSAVPATSLVELNRKESYNMENTNAIRVLTALVNQPGSKMSEIIEDTGMTRHKVRRILMNAILDGDAKKTGDRNSTRYFPG